MSARLAQTLHETFPAFPGVSAGFAVGFYGVGGFSGAHETVACAFVGDGLESFARGFHVGDGVGKGGADALIIAGVEAVDGGLDSGHGIFVWRRALKHERGGKIRSIGCETEGLAASPTETGYEKFTVCGGQFQRVIGYRV